MNLEYRVIRETVAKLPAVKGNLPQKIGYVVNFSFHIWYKVVEAYMRARADQYRIDEFLLYDAAMDLQTQLKAIDALIAAKVDAMVVTPVPSRGVESIVEKAARARIPLVLEANPVPQMATMVAICDYDAGFKAGVWAGDHMNRRGIQQGHLLDIAYPTLRPCLMRSDGFLDGLRSVLPESFLVEQVNGEARMDVSRQQALAVLQDHPDVNVVFGMDDESIHGGIEAVQQLGRSAEEITLVGFGLAGDEEKERLLAGTPLKASLAMFPELVGVRCVDQAIRLFNGMPVRVHDIVPTVAVSKETVTQYFTQTENGWLPNFEAISGIPTEERCTKT